MVEGDCRERLRAYLLNDFQRDFPLTSTPFADIAHSLGCSESEVIANLHELQAGGTISRVGAVFRPGGVGVSTLAAMSVPPERLEAVAELISGFPEVNHNYEREHAFNLWFVVTAEDELHLDQAIQAMECCTGLEVMSLPMLEGYHIDLGFPLDGKGLTDAASGEGRG